MNVLVCERVERGQRRSFAWMRTRCDGCQALVWVKVADLKKNPKSRVLCKTCEPRTYYFPSEEASFEVS